MIAEPKVEERTVKPCRVCKELLVFTQRHGWCHIAPGQWLRCSCKGEPKPVTA